MASPPPEQNKESNKISMTVEKWEKDQQEQLSPVHRISGFPWYLRLSKCGTRGSRTLYLHCDKSSESELFRCTATIETSFNKTERHTFKSWDEESQKIGFIVREFKEGTLLELEIKTVKNGEKWMLSPILDPLEPLDGILLIGKEKKEIPVHKTHLSAHSGFFDKLFNGNLEERKMRETVMEDVDYEDFANIIKLVHGSDNALISDDNVRRVLDLAVQFNLKVVRNRAYSFLLSSSSFLSIPQKLLITDEIDVPIFMKLILSEYKEEQLETLSKSSELYLLSRETLALVCKKRFRHLKRTNDTPNPPIICQSRKESSKISLTVDRWDRWASGKFEQFSAVHRINGFPWRFRIYKAENGGRLELQCDKSSEAELWECTATLKKAGIWITNTFNSWNEKSQKLNLNLIFFEQNFEVDIVTEDDGDIWRRRPTLDPMSLRDGILVFGDDVRKIHVNKESLSSQSPYFEALFNHDFKERNMNEISIGEVEYEEFHNMLKLVYGFAGASLTDDNLPRVLLLAGRFQLKIVEDRVVSYLLSSSSSFSIHEKLLISDQYNLSFLQDKLVSQYTKSELMELSDSPEWDELSPKITRVITKRCCALIH